MKLDSCCGNIGGADNSARLNVYRAFPWIGIYLYALLANGQRKQSYMILAFICLIMIFYCLYLSAIYIWSILLFYKSIPKGLDENFYGFIAFLEFSTLLFMRTRSSLKWFPRFSAVFIISFLYYVQYTAYGFYSMALYLLIATNLGMLAYHLILFEMPALNWNPSYHFTPSLESPRTLFFPAFPLSWNQDLPQLWTMFYPLFGRSTFTQAQLSFVDRDNQLLNQTLDNAFNRGQNIQQETEEAFNVANPDAAAAHNNHEQSMISEPESSSSLENPLEQQGSVTSPLQGRRSQLSSQGIRNFGGRAAEGERNRNEGIMIGGSPNTHSNANPDLMNDANQDLESHPSQLSSNQGNSLTNQLRVVLGSNQNDAYWRMPGN